MKDGEEEDSPLHKMEITLKAKEEKVKELEVSTAHLQKIL